MNKNGRAGLVIAYGMLTLLGGIIGFVKAGSLLSLVTGTFSGMLLILSAVAMLKNYTLGSLFAILLSASIGIFFCYRFALTQSMMPAGLMVLLSALVVTTLLISKGAPSCREKSSKSCGR
jgi:uncharacterized membrane protein (UPF0136 family)